MRACCCKPCVATSFRLPISRCSPSTSRPLFRCRKTTNLPIEFIACSTEISRASSAPIDGDLDDMGEHEGCHHCGEGHGLDRGCSCAQFVVENGPGVGGGIAAAAMKPPSPMATRSQS